MSNEPDHAERAREVLGFSRWWLVAAAAGMMAVVGPYQYVWSVIREPVARQLGIEQAVLSTVFTLFVIFQAGSQFPVGWWRDRHGPRGISLLAAVLAGGGYLGVAYASTVWQVYLFYSLGAVGVGIVYTVAVNTALKWFPDRRGLTSGVGTMAFAGGSAALVPYIRWRLGPEASQYAYVEVLRNIGLLITVVILVGAFVIRDPPSGWLETEEGVDLSFTGPQFTWREMLRTWQFWLMYAMFVAVSGAGLMVTEKIVSYADHLGTAAIVATLAATVLPLASAAGRLIVGDLSDRFDLTNVMATSFVLCGVGVLGIVYFGIHGAGAALVGAVVLGTFFWAPQYTLFPSAVGQYYGEEHSSANYALLYSGKMWGGVFGGTLTGFFVGSMGWNQTFLLGGVLAILAGVAALFLRSPSAAPAE
ncbi:OFA family MFS transporter [Halospeciosus flavus]|uniref:OFA family MFS transporter n=1 Tax=Halospeciosus flavus TaxID=3032283 RepID=A0ABD5Z4U0_9EURY|nr:OFA family MFS transporter [Halospeciosus flavus]